MSSITVNGTTMGSPSSLSIDESEESFVVLSKSEEPETPDQILSTNSSLVSSTAAYPSIPAIPVTDEVSQVISVMSTSVTSELSAEEIQVKLESLLQENLQLKDTLHQNNLAMKKQFSTLVMWQEDVMKVHQSHKEKFEETKKLISNLRAENAELKKATSLPPSGSSGINSDKLTLNSKISALEFELDTLRQANIKYKNEQSKIVQELEAKLAVVQAMKQEEITKLNMQVESLTAQFRAVEAQFKISQQKLAEATVKIPSEADLQAVDTMKQQLKELATEVMLKNKVLKEKTDLIDKLHEEISKLKIENETIPILKTQVEVYQTDFNQERDARNALKQEKDRIAEDLHHLQRRNQQLLEEVDRLRESTYVHVRAPSAPRQPTGSPAHTPSPSRESPPSAQYVCPLCENRFRSLRSLEEHVDNCIQNSS